MAAAVTADHHNPAGRPRKAGPLPANPDALDHATRLVHRVCCLAGSGDFVANIRANNRSLRLAIQDHDTPALFDWLIEALSYRGISDRVAHDYMEEHGRATWAEVAANLAAPPSCPKLKGYWRFHGCHYHKTSGTCTEPDHVAECPLPIHRLRNGRLNQTAYSLYLFIRDISEELRAVRVKSCCAPSARQRIGELYFLHFANA